MRARRLFCLGAFLRLWSTYRSSHARLMLSTRTYVAHFLYVAFLSLVQCSRLVRTGRIVEVWAFGAHRTHMGTGRMPVDVGHSRLSGALSVCIIKLSCPGCRVSTVV